MWRFPKVPITSPSLSAAVTWAGTDQTDGSCAPRRTPGWCRAPSGEPTWRSGSSDSARGSRERFATLATPAQPASRSRPSQRRAGGRWPRRLPTNAASSCSTSATEPTFSRCHGTANTWAGMMASDSPSILRKQAVTPSTVTMSPRSFGSPACLSFSTLPPPPDTPQAEFRGTVRDQSGSPVEGFQVTAHSPDGTTFGSGTSDATGAFAFEAPAGTYVFAVGALGCRLGWHHSDDGMVASQDDATRIGATVSKVTRVEIRLRYAAWEPVCGE